MFYAKKLIAAGLRGGVSEGEGGGKLHKKMEMDLVSCLWVFAQ